MRLNPVAMERTLAMSFGAINYFHYTSDEPSYNATTQEPVLTGTLVVANTDIQDVTINEVKVAGGLIDVTSKKYIVGIDNDLQKGDEVLDDSLLEQFRIIFVNEFANRKQLFVNKTLEDNNQH